MRLCQSAETIVRETAVQPGSLPGHLRWVSHIEYAWEDPSLSHFLRRLASFSRLILLGIAVHTGARVVSLAGAGAVLVSGTVKDLVAGS